ncbi:hypothetical protein BDM02DRAFT_3061523, partial [Thelephora ganbajun]
TITPPPPQGPSLEYITASDDPSHLLTDPASSRKLLVLDLNGTLLHRSPHPSKNAPRYPIPGRGDFQPRLRSVHPRPYLPSFKSYIFHPSNKEWLDIMVWSSAQPHSVHDMVDQCFHDEKHHFVAIWARDTLGLPQHLYSRKVQTLKDLNIPWSKLFTPSDPPGAVSLPTSCHTAMSTLLMDDSPRKAELQPYNHLCVKEYSNIIRNRDLASLLEEKARTFQQLSQSMNPFVPSRTTHHSRSHPHLLLTEAPTQSAPSTQGNLLPLVEIITEETKPLSNPPPSKKRKRRGKREAERKASRANPVPVIEYDETLLAIVGILDEVKHQSNIASWVKANGLWGPYPPQSLAIPSIDALTRGRFHASREDIVTLSDSGSVDSERRGEGKKKRRDAIAAFFEASVTEGPEDGAPPYALKNEKQDQTNSLEAQLWFDDPPTMRHWVDRGRNILEALGIPIEHGLKQ